MVAKLYPWFTLSVRPLKYAKLRKRERECERKRRNEGNINKTSPREGTREREKDSAI